MPDLVTCPVCEREKCRCYPDIDRNAGWDTTHIEGRERQRREEGDHSVRTV